MKKTKERTAQARHSRQEGTGTASVNPCPAYALFKSAIQLRVSVRLPRKRGETDPPQADRRPVGDPGSQTPLHSTATPPRARPARTLGPPTKDVPNALPPHGGALGRMRSGSGSSVAGGEQKGNRPSSTAFQFASRLGAPTDPRSPAGGSIIAYPLEVPWERHGVPLGRLRRGPRGCATGGPNLTISGVLYTEVSPGSGVRPRPPGHLSLHLVLI